MIHDHGRHGNFRVQCDAYDCKKSYVGRRAHNDWVNFVWYTPAKVRRQARRRGWGARRDFLGAVSADYCPEHKIVYCLEAEEPEFESVDQRQLPASTS